MQMTKQGKLFPSTTEAAKMDELMRLQSSCMRYSYNRLCENESKKEVEADIKQKFGEINSRYRRGGYFRAKNNHDSAKEQVKTGELESPEKVVFGGRENLRKREQGEITNEVWKRLRNNQLYSRGDESKGGNLNLRFVEKNDQLHLRVNTGDRRWVHIPAYLSTETRKRVIEGNEAYGVRILRENGRYGLRVNFEENHETMHSFEKGSVGMDFNHGTIDLAVTNKEGQLKDAKTIDCSGLTSARKGKREWLIGNYAKKVVDYAKYWNRGISMENLKDVARGQGNQHMFTHRKFLEAVERRAEKKGVKTREVNPAFTSVIGEWKYSTPYSITTHQASALVIARRGKGIHEELKGLKTLAFEAREAGEGEENVPNRRVHSWSLWKLIGNLPLRQGARHRHPKPTPQNLNGPSSDGEVSGMESSGTSASTERRPGEDGSSGRKTAIPGNGPRKNV